jgi:hypothetical protein
MQPAPPPPPLTLPPSSADHRALPSQLTWGRLVGLLIAVALVAALATAGTGFGLLYYLAQRPVPTVAPAYRVPAYQPPAPARTNPLQPSTEQRLQEAERQACDAQKRAYAAQEQAYQAQKQAQAQGEIVPTTRTVWR